MRIDEKDVQKRVAEICKDAGFNVYAGEVAEGFKKPAVFVSVYPASITLEGADMETVTDTVTITYMSSVETVEDCADAARQIKNAFMYKPFDVKDRRLTIQAIEFEIEDYVLYAFFDVEYYQPTPEPDEIPETIQTIDLKINEKTAE